MVYRSEAPEGMKNWGCFHTEPDKKLGVLQLSQHPSSGGPVDQKSWGNIGWKKGRYQLSKKKGNFFFRFFNKILLFFPLSSYFP